MTQNTVGDNPELQRLSYDFRYDFARLGPSFNHKSLSLNNKRISRKETPDTIPTAQSGWHEPSLPGANDGSTPTPPSDVTKKSSGRSRGHRKKVAISASKEVTAQPSGTSKVAKQ
jgi:hypothetical protein